MRWVHGLRLNARDPDCRVGRKCRSGVGGIQAIQKRLPCLASRRPGRTLKSLGTHRVRSVPVVLGGPEGLEALENLEAPAYLETPADLGPLRTWRSRRTWGSGRAWSSSLEYLDQIQPAVAHIGAYEYRTSYSGGGLQLIDTGLAIPQQRNPART